MCIIYFIDIRFKWEGSATATENGQVKNFVNIDDSDPILVII